MKAITLVALLALITAAAAQTKDEEIKRLCGATHRYWSVIKVTENLGTDKLDKLEYFVFDKSGAARHHVPGKPDEKSQWSLQSSDGVTWFLTIGTNPFELNFDRDKKGQSIMKLQEVPKTSSLTKPVKTITLYVVT